MFGNNPIRKQHLDPDGTLAVQELFTTIQGEGPFAGRPAVFLRLSGCNLKCWFCDTDFESKRSLLAPKLAALSIKRRARSRAFHSDLLVITGGEPLLQNLLPLLEALGDSMQVQIETAGTVWVPGLEEYLDPKGETTLVCSPKTGKIAKEIERYCWHYKYIVSVNMPVDEKQGIPFQATQSRALTMHRHPLYYPANLASTIWLQPCDEQSELINKENQKLCAALAMKHGHRVSLQQHKILQLP